MATTSTTATTNRKPIIVRPACPSRRGASRHISALVDATADPSEGETRDVVPIEPYEERATADVVVRDESPITAVIAVVAVVSHHEIVAGRHATRESSVIVVAVAPVRKWPNILWVDRLRRR